ncbi:MAG: methionine biosynthesis protein MetW, partial [Desulfarculaceae bacterium]
MQDQPKETASAGKTPDYESLTAEVKKTVEEKRAQGFYDPEEEQRVAQMEVEFIQPQEDGAEAEIRLHQQKLAQLWDSKACGVQTHRPGPAGRLLLKFKRLFHRLTRFPVNIWLARQALFNDELVKLLNLLLLQHTDLRQRVARDEKRLDSLENLEGPIGARLNALDKGVVHRLDGHDQNLAEHDKRFEQVQRYADARVAALEREAGKGHSQIEQTLARLQDILEKQAGAGLASSAASQAVSQERARLRASAYLAFEDMHRGSSQDIKKRQEVYVPIFKESVTPEKPLLDIGCGRGEFLELAREAGITARGVDLNPEMAAFCREQGLEVAEADALEYLRQLP